MYEEAIDKGWISFSFMCTFMFEENLLHGVRILLILNAVGSGSAGRSRICSQNANSNIHEPTS